MKKKKILIENNNESREFMHQTIETPKDTTAKKIIDL